MLHTIFLVPDFDPLLYTHTHTSYWHAISPVAVLISMFNNFGGERERSRVRSISTETGDVPPTWYSPTLAASSPSLLLCLLMLPPSPYAYLAFSLSACSRREREREGGWCHALRVLSQLMSAWSCEFLGVYYRVHWFWMLSVIPFTPCSM